MAELLTLTPKPDYRKLAVEKIAQELQSFKGDRYGEAVKKHVASTLTHFCEENERFAEVVYKTKRTLSDCCAEIMKGCGSCISDIDVYRGAVRNYFPNADITFHMTIAINGDAPTEEELNRAPKAKTKKKEAPEKKTTTANTMYPGVFNHEKDTAPAPAPAPAAPPKPKAESPKKQKQSKKGAFSDPDMIQLTLF